MQSKREHTQQYPWHAALLSDGIESLTSGRVASYDCNVESYSGFSALHCLIFKLLINSDYSFRVTYKSIVLFLHTGFAVDSQCKLGFTPLCMAFLRTVQQSSDLTSSQVIERLINSRVQTNSEPKWPNCAILRNICLILLENGASLKLNQHRLSPLSYTQLYYHTNPDSQDWLLFNYPRNIDLEELFKLSLLKAVTPEKNYRAVLKTVVKHGIPFQQQPVYTEISLKSILCVLIQIHYCIGLEEFCHIYNLPSYHCIQPIEQIASLRGYELEIIGAATYFINKTYTSYRKLQRQHSKSKPSSFGEFSNESRVFLVFTIFIAIWGSQVQKDIDYPYLVYILSKEFKSESILHLIITTKDLWSKEQYHDSSRRSRYFSRILFLIYDGLWSVVAHLMCNQVNNRDFSHMGYTPLHIAANNHDIETIKFLISQLGAYPYAVSAEGKTFYELNPMIWNRVSILEKKQYSAFVNSLINQVRPLKTICATKIVEYDIDLKPLMGKSKLCLFVNLHKPCIKFSNV